MTSVFESFGQSPAGDRFQSQVDGNAFTDAHGTTVLATIQGLVFSSAFACAPGGRDWRQCTGTPYWDDVVLPAVPSPPIGYTNQPFSMWVVLARIAVGTPLFEPGVLNIGLSCATVGAITIVGVDSGKSISLPSHSFAAPNGPTSTTSEPGKGANDQAHADTGRVRSQTNFVSAVGTNVTFEAVPEVWNMTTNDDGDVHTITFLAPRRSSEGAPTEYDFILNEECTITLL